MALRERFEGFLDRLGKNDPEKDKSRQQDQIDLAKARIRNLIGHEEKYTDRELGYEIFRAKSHLAELMGIPVDDLKESAWREENEDAQTM